ncbi:MAG: prepilin peptidase [Candidatus Lloydbacteria bacterium]|nr:prepilin peptidase [Candidatus Lloydbacteria bacterium]
MDTVFIYFAATAIFVFGTIIGSFLNVVVARYQSGLTMGGRSKCFVCGKTLGWRELFPIVSFLLQKGRCKTCKSAISWQYPVIELLTGLVFLALFAKFFFYGSNVGLYENVVLLLYTLFIASLLIVIAGYDFKHSVIPDGFVYAFDLAAFGSLFAGGVFNAQAGIAGGVFFLFFGALWLFSRGRAMGFGDAKLALGLGWLLGFAQGIAALLVAFWSGTIIGLLLIGISKIRTLSLPGKYFTLKSEIPFGPFLVFGALISFLFRLDVSMLVPLFSFYV